MPSIRQLVQRLWAFFRRDTLDRELDAEIAGHLVDLAAQENLAAGITPQRGGLLPCPARHACGPGHGAEE